MKPLPNDWRFFAAAGAAFATAAGFALFWKYRRRPDVDEIERKRRAYINQVGRIAEGRVTELVEVVGESHTVTRFGILGPKTTKISAASNHCRQMVCYSYSISGVTYETAQDITSLENRALVARLVSGQIASVKYDPSNPSNSIVVADDWSGVP